MKKITYWIADCLNDSRCYSIREKTRTAVVAKLADLGPGSEFGTPRKVSIEYQDTFDLLCMAMGEGSLYEGRAQDRYPQNEDE